MNTSRGLLFDYEATPHLNLLEKQLQLQLSDYKTLNLVLQNMNKRFVTFKVIAFMCQSQPP